MALIPAGRGVAVIHGLAEGWRAVALACSLLFLLLIISGLPFASVLNNRIFSHTVGPFLFLLAATFYTWRGGRRAGPAEKRFWRQLSLGYGVWAATYVPSLITRLSGHNTDSILPYLDFGFALSFFFVVVAVEERPDDRGPLSELGRRPSLWNTAILMAGFFSTLVVLPATYNRADYPTYLSSFGYFVAMDLAIATRLLYFASQSESRRWRTIYALLATGFALMLVVDLTTAWLRREHAALTVGAFYDAFWTLPFFVMLLSASTASWRLGDRRSGIREPTISDAFAASTLTWALVFPCFHLIADRLGWLDPVLAPKRDVLVLLWTVMLLALAILRQRQLEKDLALLVRERREIEVNLRDSEKDLRLLVERSRVADRLQAAEERFAKAFEASPDALILSNFDDGTVLDVNPAFSRLSQLTRKACLGRTAEELALWPFPERRARLLENLRQRKPMHDLPGDLRRADGRVCAVRASFERIQGMGEDLLLTVLRNAESNSTLPQHRVATLLENTRVPLRLMQENEEGELTPFFVNATARLALRRDGRETEILGTSGFRLLLHLPTEGEST